MSTGRTLLCCEAMGSPNVMSTALIILAPKGQSSKRATCCKDSCPDGISVVLALQVHLSAESRASRSRPSWRRCSDVMESKSSLERVVEKPSTVKTAQVVVKACKAAERHELKPTVEEPELNLQHVWLSTTMLSFSNSRKEVCDCLIQ